MINSPLTVSVCVMSYNLEKYISEALDSILMQKVNFRYNIIIGDDCSTDNTPKILQEYATKYPDKFTLLLQKSNLGILENFAATLKVCDGKYLALLDGDDYWTDPLKLQKQVDFLEANKEYSMVFHNTELHDHTENGILVKPFNLDKQSREYTANEIVETWSVTTCSVLCINKEQYRYIEKNLWFPVQDLPFFLCCASIGKIYYLPETMCVYRRVPTGSQYSEEFRSVKIHLVFIEYFKALYNDFSDLLSKKTLDRVSASHYLFAAQKSRKNGEEKGYLKYLTLAIVQDSQYIYEKEIQATQKNIQKIADQKLEKLRHKYNEDINEVNKKFDILKDNYNLLMESISNINQQNTLINPIKKYKTYKIMLKTYWKLQRSKNGKK